MNGQELRKQLTDSVREDYNARVASGEIQGDPLPDPEGSAAPPAAPPEAPAAPAPTAGTPQDQGKQEPAKPDLTSMIDPENGLYIGKYKDPQAWKDGYYKMVTEASRVADENTRLKEQLGQSFGQGLPLAQNQPQAPTVPGSLPGSDPRVNPAARDWKNERTVVKLAEDLGGVVSQDTLADFAEAIGGGNQGMDPVSIKATVQEAVQSALAPMQAQTQAEAYMRKNHPDAFNHQPELELYLKTADPQTRQTVNSLMAANDYAGAMEFAWMKYQRGVNEVVQVQAQADAQGSEAQRQAARAAAAMPSSVPGTPPHAADPTAQKPDAEQIKQLMEAARTNGPQSPAARKLRELTIGSQMVGPDETLRQRLDRLARI